MTKDELHNRLPQSRAPSLARQSIGDSSMVWCSMLRCVSRLLVRVVVTTGWSLSPTRMTLGTTGLRLVCARSVMKRLRFRGKDSRNAKTTEDEGTRRSA